MKFLPLLSILFLATPSQAITWKEFWEPFNDGHHHHHYYRPQPRPRYHHYQDEICTKKVYREEYIPGDIHRPGYVRKWRDSFRVPCD